MSNKKRPQGHPSRRPRPEVTRRGRGTTLSERWYWDLVRRAVARDTIEQIADKSPIGAAIRPREVS